jgi:acyl-CoA dehydrogenase
VMLYGTEAQKEKYLPLYCKDQYIYGSLAVMEPSVTFDTNSILTTATLEGGEWVLNGSKCYVPLASKAEHILVLAALNKGLGEKGLGAFIVDKGTYGMEISEKEKNMGFKPLHTNEITFADCKIPRENRLGGDAGINISQLISCSRVGLAAMAVGVARASLQYALQYAKDRVAFGEPIASRQAIAFMLADMAIEVDATRYLVWEAAWRLERGDDGYKEAYLAKRYAANQSMLVTDYGIQVLGGHGYIREHPVEMWFRNARGIATLEGMVVL